MLNCGFEERAFIDLTIQEKVKFFQQLAKDWTKNDPKDFNKGYNAQSGAIQKEVQSRKGTQNLRQRESAQKRNKKSQAGVFNSGAEADDDDL